MKYRPEACGVAGTVIAHMCRDKVQATMDTIKIRTSKDKDKDVHVCDDRNRRLVEWRKKIQSQ